MNIKERSCQKQSPNKGKSPNKVATGMVAIKLRTTVPLML